MRQVNPDRSGRSLLLATAASVTALVVSMQFAETPWWRDNPMIHPAIATIAASITFWLTWPNRNLVKLWVFMLIAFAVLTIATFTIAVVSLMPS